MAKHFTLDITDEAFTFTRNHHDIAAEAALDGIYMLRTSLPTDTLTDDDVVLRYKSLADVERFFRCLNSELDVRPIRHRLAHRVRAHMFLRMLSYYISWHMKAALAPILFVDNDKPAAAAKRANPVAPAQRSDEALTKAARKRTHDDEHPVHSFTSLLADLATLCANQIQPTDHTRSIHHHHHPHPTAEQSLRTPRPLTPPGIQVGSTPHPQNPKAQLNTPTRQHARGNFGLAVAALFELFVKRERPQQVSYRILPNFVEFLVGRLISGVATASIEREARHHRQDNHRPVRPSPPDAPPARCCPGCPAAPAGADLAAKLVERSVDAAGLFGTHRGQ